MITVIELRLLADDMHSRNGYHRPAAALSLAADEIERAHAAISRLRAMRRLIMTATLA